MLTEKWVKEKVAEFTDEADSKSILGYSVSYPSLWVEGFAEAIAAAAEADKADALFALDATWKEVETELLVQIEEMREAADQLILSLEIDDIKVPIETAQAFHRLKEALAAVPKRVLAMTTLSQEYDDISETIVYKTGWEPPEDVEFHVEVFGAAQARFSKAKSVSIAILTKPEESGEG